ncbi:hypothetical protein [Lederbergia graminis]|uniref:hypothetical protein n=1 Tax=Lederbergia graminis TaxID=735518 RepID=UPI0036D33EF2
MLLHLLAIVIVQALLAMLLHLLAFVRFTSHATSVTGHRAKFTSRHTRVTGHYALFTGRPPS